MKVVSLFDLSGSIVKPWADAEYDCWVIDIQHKKCLEVRNEEGCIHYVPWDLSTPWLPPFEREEIAFVAAAPPCQHLSVSGARWMKGKGLRKLSHAIQLFATAVEFCEWSKAPYFIENPVSTISTYWRKPDYKFHPYQYSMFDATEHYKKDTCLWVGGGFVMPDKSQADLGEPDDRIHKAAPGPERANFRSKTPYGFAKAVFLANEPNKPLD
jgi:hypothetical protein